MVEEQDSLDVSRRPNPGQIMKNNYVIKVSDPVLKQGHSPFTDQAFKWLVFEIEVP